MPFLGFIDDDKLTSHISRVFRVLETAKAESETEFHRNSIDPFYALIHALGQELTYEEWQKGEISRQVGKTLQNAIGDFHQCIIGDCHGWENLGAGGLLDVRNEERRIVAEIKNKFNTTKGNHKTSIYDDIKQYLDSGHSDYTGYYVEIIPQAGKHYNKEFIPSDNKTHAKRPNDSRIRLIDGKSFYAIVTGDEDAIYKIFDVIPSIYAIINESSQKTEISIENFIKLMQRIFPS